MRGWARPFLVGLLGVVVGWGLITLVSHVYTDHQVLHALDLFVRSHAAAIDRLPK